MDKDPISVSSPPPLPPIIIEAQLEVKAKLLPPLVEEPRIPKQPQAELIEEKSDTNIAESPPVVDAGIVILTQEDIASELEKHDIPADIKTESHDTAIEM